MDSEGVPDLVVVKVHSLPLLPTDLEGCFAYWGWLQWSGLHPLSAGLPELVGLNAGSGEVDRP